MITGTIVVVGEVMTDVIVRVEHPLALASDTPARIRLAHGGSAANTAAWLARAGADAAFVGCVGDDAFGREAVEALRAAGVRPHVAVAPGLATGTCVVLVATDGERTMLPDAGANAALATAEIPEGILAEGGHLHVSGYSLIAPGSRDAAVVALARARAAGMTTSVDPASAAPLARLGGERFMAITSGVGLAIATLDEAEVLVGTRNPALALERLAAAYGEAVLKLGADGAAWLGRGVGEAITVPAAPPPGIVLDTTGAGDAFAAAWLAARGVGAGPGEALEAACALAAEAVTREGARP